MSASNFIKFPDLPTEMRLEIWSLCLPGRRVVEINMPLSMCLSTSTLEPATVRSNRLPVISRVCRESREVVFKSAFFVGGQGGPPGLPRVSHPGELTPYCNHRLWMRRGIDVVHLNWHPDEEMSSAWDCDIDLLEAFRCFAQQASAASISAELLHAFGDHELDGAARCNGPQILCLCFPCFVVLSRVKIHISDLEAAHSGVFGILGEEPIQLVDPRDTNTIRKFRKAWRSSSCRQLLDEPEVDHFFTSAVDEADIYCASIEQWRAEAEKSWMILRTIRGRLDCPRSDEVWVGQERPHSQRPPGTLQRSTDLRARQLNKENAWVQELLASMPRFDPVIMFRHCNQMCGLPGDKTGAQDTAEK
ncbi:hypothetical protein PG984_004694 [Apiospora sp. TS-2023a]